MRVGAIELRLLEHMMGSGPTTVRGASETFGKEHEIGLTTVGQMLERLRKKGLVTRHQDQCVWVYTAEQSKETVMRDVVADFVTRTLGGSIEPLMLYLTDRSQVSEEEFAKFRSLVDQLSDEGIDHAK